MYKYKLIFGIPFFFFNFINRIDQLFFGVKVLDKRFNLCFGFFFFYEFTFFLSYGGLDFLVGRNNKTQYNGHCYKNG